MCGIAGVVAESEVPGAVQIVRRMCSVMSHRGPDDSGIYVDGGTTLGHVRLSIIDLAGGHQPLSNEDGSIWVVFNGEIYNYEELRRTLLRAGHTFRTNTDTEVLVHLYEEYGADLAASLNGMFAFALWDARRRALLLFRDHVGIKPLYYSLVGGRLAFASELKSLLEVPGVSSHIDREGIAEYLTLGYITAPRTPFSQIRKLPSGSYLQYHDGALVESRYWRVPVEEPAAPSVLGDVCEEIRFILRDATRLQLRADVPVGVFASGGIDSTAIMWAASHHGIPLQAFLCEFDDLRVDTPYARLAAHANGMQLHEKQLSAEQAGALLPRLIWHQDEPLADPALVPVYLIAKEAAGHVKVILNGTGGDELFGGYPRYRVRGLLPGAWSGEIGRAASEFAGGGAVSRRMGAALDYRQRYLRRMATLPEQEVRSALGLTGPGVVSATAATLFAETRSRDAASAMMYYDLNVYLTGDLLMVLDKMTMAASLEARVPLLDFRLVECAARLSGRLRMRGGELKWLLREALRGHVPDAILDRPKQGFGPPVSHWMRGALGRNAMRLVLGKRAMVCDLLGAEVVQSWLSRRTAAGRDSARRLWLLLVLELWLRTFTRPGCSLDPEAITLLGSGEWGWTSS